MVNAFELSDAFIAGETSSAEVVRELKDREETQKISTSLGGETRFDSWLVEYRAAYSQSGEEEPNMCLGFASANS